MVRRVSREEKSRPHVTHRRKQQQQVNNWRVWLPGRQRAVKAASHGEKVRGGSGKRNGNLGMLS
jgi:hypothetical protein